MIGEHAIARADVLAALKELPDCSVDGVLCDPPYGFRFMGKTWDYDVPSVEVWRELFRVMKPGAYLLSFGGARTFHRIAIGIEDAGFELRDCLMWLYGKGFPKSQDVSKAIDKAAGAEREVVGPGKRHNSRAFGAGEGDADYGTFAGGVPPVTAPATDLAAQWAGYGTALKPAWEPILLARKPLDGTMAENVARWGTGGLAIDACRIEAHGRPALVGTGIGYQTTGTGGSGSSYAAGTTDEGRWPANLVLDDEAGAALDADVGNVPSRKAVTRNGGGNQGGALHTKRVGKVKPDSGYTDDGGPSRFFYCAKVSTREREHGCEHLPMHSAAEMTDSAEGAARLQSPRTGAGRTGGAHNPHPTLKPIALTRWLASLIKPPTEDATLLVPYAGVGSEMIGGLLAGWPTVFGIEGDFDDVGYVNIAHARIAAWCPR